ncbi:hypothetical protein ATK74_0837 [Propionicimonas paludicola]|uniref:Uncharacterized protein n=1 Tax=Propionicimonas paludicola TaxID=185243 RepID=A0A2A9CPH9_9ACTN|nr:hypothetical protein [Propionicimonas paludicola]PFG16303.1 hypothetical protein ATK74_0837 [Propionicimonas paludicola]
MTTRCDLDAIEARYSKALDAKPGKGEYSPDGIAAIVDSHCDVRELVAEVKALRGAAMCGCGSPATLGTVHRANSPCYVAELDRVLPSREEIAKALYACDAATMDYERLSRDRDGAGQPVDYHAEEWTRYLADADAILALITNAPTVEQVKAPAWDEGHRAGYADRAGYENGDGCGPDSWDCDCPNPYRTSQPKGDPVKPAPVDGGQVWSPGAQAAAVALLRGHDVEREQP